MHISYMSHWQQQCSVKVPVHVLLVPFSLKPALQLSHDSFPSFTHFAPVDAVPLRQEHLLAMHLVLSSLAVHPVTQLDTSHPDV